MKTSAQCLKVGIGIIERRMKTSAQCFKVGIGTGVIS